MLNMNVYPSLNRFKYGFDLVLGGAALNRYLNGEWRGRLSFLTLISSGTGHWPFIVFELNFLTGNKNAWQLTVLGLTVGSKMMHNFDPDTGEILGPDKRIRYWYFSAINHQHKEVEETINANKIKCKS